MDFSPLHFSITSTDFIFHVHFQIALILILFIRTHKFVEGKRTFFGARTQIRCSCFSLPLCGRSIAEDTAIKKKKNPHIILLKKCHCSVNKIQNTTARCSKNIDKFLFQGYIYDLHLQVIKNDAFSTLLIIITLKILITRTHSFEVPLFFTFLSCALVHSYEVGVLQVSEK